MMDFRRLIFVTKIVVKRIWRRICYQCKKNYRPPAKVMMDMVIATAGICILLIAGDYLVPGSAERIIDSFKEEVLPHTAPSYSAVKAAYPAYSGGTLYDQQYGRIYIPNEVTDNTSFSVFFCGGCGDDNLPYNMIYQYYRYYSPDAVMLWVNQSYWTTPQKAAGIAFGVFTSIADDAGITFGPDSTLCTAGASAGGYTAIATAEYFWDDYGIPVKSIAVFDMSNEWQDSGSALLEAEQCADLADSRTHIFAFEQNHLAGGGGTVYTMQNWQRNIYMSRLINNGVNFTFVNCKEGSHKDIEYNGLRYDVFGHMLSETMNELPANHYILINPMDFANGAQQSDYSFSQKETPSDDLTKDWYQ